MNAPNTCITPVSFDVSVFGNAKRVPFDAGPPTPIAAERLRQLRRSHFGRTDEDTQIKEFAKQLTQVLAEMHPLFCDHLKKLFGEMRIEPARPWTITPEYIRKIEEGATPEIAVLFALNRIHGLFEMDVGKRWHEAGAFEDQATARDTLRAWQQYFGLTPFKLEEMTGHCRETFSKIAPRQERKKENRRHYRIAPSLLSEMASFYELVRRHPGKNYIPGASIMQVWTQWDAVYGSDSKAFSHVLIKTLERLGIFHYARPNSVASFCDEMGLCREEVSRYRRGRKQGDVKKATVVAYAQAFELWMERHCIPLEALDAEKMLPPNGFAVKRAGIGIGATPSGSSVPGSR